METLFLKETTAGPFGGLKVVGNQVISFRKGVFKNEKNLFSLWKQHEP